MKVLILGANLTGFLAARACLEVGAEPIIANRPKIGRSESLFVNPAEFNHAGIATEPTMVRTSIEGNFRRFRTKAGVLANELEPLVSESDVIQPTSARLVYDPDVLEDELMWDLDSFMLPSNPRRAENHDLIVTTDARFTCGNLNCSFYTDEFIHTPYSKYSALGNNSIALSGESDDWWFASWYLNGRGHSLYPADRAPNNVPTMKKFEVPTGTTCKCNSDILRVGKGGEWSSTAKTTDGYTKTIKHLREMMAAA